MALGSESLAEGAVRLRSEICPLDSAATDDAEVFGGVGCVSRFSFENAETVVTDPCLAVQILANPGGMGLPRRLH